MNIYYACLGCGCLCGEVCGFIIGIYNDYTHFVDKFIHENNRFNIFSLLYNQWPLDNLLKQK